MPSMIPCKNITEPKISKEERTFVAAAAKNLATSIKEVGLLHPIGVRQIGSTDLYELVYGTHRLVAVRDYLKLPEIASHVHEDMGNEEATYAKVAENLWRTSMKKAQHLKAVRKWSEIYEKRHALVPVPEEAKIPSPAPVAEAEPEKPQEKTQAVPAPVSSLKKDKTRKPGQGRKAAVKTFPQELAQVTGMPYREACRTVKVAKSFTDEQMDAMNRVKITERQLDKLAAIQDAKVRNDAVVMVCSGMDVDKALEASKPREEGDPLPETALSDDDWLAKYCGEFLKRLGRNTEAYKASALFYRAIRDARAEFRKSTKKALARAQSGGPVGGMVRRVAAVVFCSHPTDWLICGACLGSGETKGMAAARCKNCAGDGFLVKTEAPL
ncbi:MAG: hypothetical protein NVSMB9_09200 [Isosphaeraceae bacterium]